MTDLNQLERYFEKRLAAELSSDGFEWKNRELRRFAPVGVTQYVATGLRKSPTNFDAVTRLRVRFDAVETLVHEVDDVVMVDAPSFLRPSSKQRSGSATLGAELGLLDRGNQWTVTFGRESDADEFLAELVSALRRAGLPWLERVSNLDRACRLLEGDDTESRSFSSPLPYERAKRALAAAVIAGRGGELDDIADRKRRFLRSVGDPAAERFEAFVRELRTRL